MAVNFRMEKKLERPILLISHGQKDECWSWRELVQKIEAAKERHKKAAVRRERYHLLSDNGLCVRCKQPAQPGMTLCWSCQLYNNQRRSGARQAPRG